MINVVIPMAGAGSRFQLSGYDLPKPFVDVKGKMMVERVLDGIQIPDAKYTLIIQQTFQNKHREKLDLLTQKYRVQFVTVEKLTQGASCTALAAHEIINNDDMVIFADSDNTIKKDALLTLNTLGFSKAAVEKVLDKVMKEKPDASLETVIKLALNYL